MDPLNANYITVDGVLYQVFTVCIDGSWNTRGKTSEHAIMYVTDSKTGLIIDVLVASRSDEGHSSQRLETDLAKRAYENSLKFRKSGEEYVPALYMDMIADGDAKSHKCVEHIYCDYRVDLLTSYYSISSIENCNMLRYPLFILDAKFIQVST